MEFRLNKVDPEVRQRVKETTSSGKVHNKSGITINKDSKKEKNRNGEDFSSKLEKEKNKQVKKRISVDAMKVEDIDIPVYKEEKESQSTDEVSGYILDVRK